MFEALTASHPQVQVRTHQCLLSASFHCALVAGAVALTQHAVAATRSRPPERGVLFVAPQALAQPPAATSEVLSTPTRPTPSTWSPNIEMPSLERPALSGGVPTVADILERSNIATGSASRLGLAGTSAAAGELLTAAAVDEPVSVLEQAILRFPRALADAGIAGRVELEYVVDTLGRAEPGSVRTLTSTHPAFEAAARASVLDTRYRPARLRGNRVHQLVRQTMSFQQPNGRS